MLVARALLIAVAFHATAGAYATEFTITNHSSDPIYVSVKTGWQGNWPQAVKVSPGAAKVFNFQGRGTLDIKAQWQFGGNRLQEWVATNANIEELADASRRDQRTWTKTANARLNAEWISRGGRWIRQPHRRDSCPWLFEGNNGKVSLSLPQASAGVSAPPIDTPFPLPKRPRK